MHSLPVFLRLAGCPVILTGEGEAAEAKRRLLERAGARIVADHALHLPAHLNGLCAPPSPPAAQSTRIAP